MPNLIVRRVAGAIAELFYRGQWVDHRSRLIDAIAQAIADEREACAKEVEQELSVDSGDPARWTDYIVQRIAARIRARGQP